MLIRRPAGAHYEAHHGACLGADADFDFIIRQYYPNVRRVSHPPEDATRTFDWEPFERRPLAPYLKRNRAIVDETELLIATPKSFRAEPRSETWATVRYAHKQGRKIYLVMPDGDVQDVDEDAAKRMRIAQRVRKS